MSTVAVLAMGSDGVRTSPVERGAWVLRHLVNRPPPPAPQTSRSYRGWMASLCRAARYRQLIKSNPSAPSAIERLILLDLQWRILTLRVCGESPKWSW